MAMSSIGLGSGLDVNSIVTQLVAIEKQPLQALTTKATTFQTQLSTYGTINSQVSALETAAAARDNFVTTFSAQVEESFAAHVAGLTWIMNRRAVCARATDVTASAEMHKGHDCAAHRTQFTSVTWPQCEKSVIVTGRTKHAPHSDTARLA